MKRSLGLRLVLAGTMVIAGLLFFFTDRSTHPVPYNEVHEEMIRHALEEVNDTAVEELAVYDTYEVVGVVFEPEGIMTLRIRNETAAEVDHRMLPVWEEVKGEAADVVEAHALEDDINREIELEISLLGPDGTIVHTH
ncbi:hypothetical protein [Terribacillus sp. 7520-G]|uniref:hypothetical protein n=1 Tax=Terribacillus TaxID=459532 RepID=UPI000BA6EE03|nr:hypothetical protein [Terribacillus sp. 7520-G]PAD37906.1 hypothetical protein CHH53_13670 [Terribacillus sp. 7520-G]